MLFLFTAEMFGQMMTILDRQELVLKMNSCVCVISSKWISLLVSEQEILLAYTFQ